jgi:hypothetical protein
MKTRNRKHPAGAGSWLAACAVPLGIGLCSVQAALAITPPDMTVCNGAICEDLPKNSCSDAGFAISLKSYTPATVSSNGSASYVYEICSPQAGTCSSTVRPGEPCLDNNFCRTKGQASDPAAYCSRECSANGFRGLSHFDVTFPNLATSACVTSNTAVTGSCSAVDKNNDGVFPAVGDFVLGDSSCFSSGSSGFVAKCDNTSVEPGDCIELTLNIAGETTGLGLGAAVVVDKEATTCTSSCLAGPSCDRCDDPPDSNYCLTRTLGFWGSHPWITNNFATVSSPVSVCGKGLDCHGLDDGKSDPACLAGSCYSVMEALGSNAGLELSINQPYVVMVKQLAAAKLNLAATTALAPAGSSVCTDWSYGDKSIRDWLTLCEGLCGATKSTISGSGCIEALDAFNNSQDSGFDQTPALFEQPGIDDHGATSGADSSQFVLAQGKTKPPGKLAIGKYPTGGTDCRNLP